MYIRIGLYVYSHRLTRIYASAYTYIRIGLYVYTHRPTRIYVLS